MEEVKTDVETAFPVSEDTWVKIAAEKDEDWQIEPKRRSLANQFMSIGKVASYPEHPLFIGKLNFRTYADKDGPAICRLPYSIFADPGKVATETEHLTIRMFRGS